MTAGSYLLYVAPLALVGIALVAQALNGAGASERRLQPIRIRSDRQRRR